MTATQAPQLRYPGTLRRALTDQTGPGPGRHHGPNARHARTHWNHALAAPGQCQPGQERVAVLQFVGRLADAISTCPRCTQTTPNDPTSPEQWIWWALHQRAVTRNILRALVKGAGQWQPRPPGGNALPARPRVTRGPAPARL